MAVYESVYSRLRVMLPVGPDLLVVNFENGRFVTRKGRSSKAMDDWLAKGWFGHVWRV